MDKRSLLFIFAVTFSFFFLNNYFFSTPQQPKAVKQNTEEYTISDRRVSFGEINPASLYLDQEKTEMVSYATQVGDNYLFLASSLDLPEILYVETNKGTKPVKLNTRNTHLQEPVIYSTSDTPIINAPAITSLKKADLQFVDFSKEPQAARVTYGLYQRGRLTFPKAPVIVDSVVLFQSLDGFIPVGVYDAKVQKIRFLQDYLKFKEIVQVETPIKADPQPQIDETRYVIENQYQQLVFSNRGGALAEINLPFQSNNNRLSVVQPIGTDEQIEESSPRNNFYPLFNHYGPAPRNEGLEEHPKGVEGGFYPLIRRSLLNSQGEVTSNIPPKFYALNIISEDNDTANLEYKLISYSPNMIQFEAKQPHRRIKRTYKLPDVSVGGPYCIDLEIEIEGDQRGLWISSGIPEAELIAGAYQPNFRTQITKNNKQIIEELSLPKDEKVSHAIQPDWISNSNGFFGILIDSLSNMPPGYKIRKIPGNIAPTRLTLIDPQYNLFPASKYPGYISYLPLNFGPGAIKFRVFAGPYSEKILSLVDEVYSNPVTGYQANYVSAQTIQGWFSFISEPFAAFLFFIMKLFHAFTSSWGISIILLTIALKLMLYPLNNWSLRSSVKMQAIAPQVKAIQERYKKDPKKGQIEVMNLYREKGVNPFMGCFPMLIQMPFLFGMFYLLKSSFSLRGATFIPGWIDNLAAPDVLFSWSYPVFFFGTQFHLLPVLLGLTMFWQQKMTAKLPSDASKLTDQQKQQKMMGNIMSIVFTFIFYGFPSGLNLYFLSSNLLGILQQWYVNNQINKPAVHNTVKK